MKKKLLVFLLSCQVLLSACTGNGYDNFSFPQNAGKSTITPIDQHKIETHYEDHGEVLPTVSRAASDDGLCVIENKGIYFDVTLDFEKGDHYAVGKAYGEAIMKIMPEAEGIVESYIYENIEEAFTNVDDTLYHRLDIRATILFDSIPKEYQDELNGIAEAFTSGKGMVKDGKLSFEEFRLAQFVPDAVRGTACSAVSLDGSRTSSGKRITSRLLEWYIGTENQVTKIHTVTHIKNAEKSYTAVGCLGLMTTLTAINSSGVMVGELDVGSVSEDYQIQDKTSYTFAMRYAIENYPTAREVAEYLAEHAREYTYCANILVTDEKEALCVELPVTESDGEPIIRDKNSKLLDEIVNDCQDCLIIVNAYVCAGRDPSGIKFSSNIIRWERFNEWFAGDSSFSLGSFKEIMTSERHDEQASLVQIGNNDAGFHLVIADYDTRTLQASFAKEDAKGEPPVFYEIGTF